MTKRIFSKQNVVYLENEKNELLKKNEAIYNRRR